MTVSNMEIPYNNVEMNVGFSTVQEPIVCPILGCISELKTSKCAIKRDETNHKTVYEFSLPFEDFNISLGKGKYARLALIINDIDQDGKRRYMGVKNTIFIGSQKEPYNFPVIHFE